MKLKQQKTMQWATKKTWAVAIVWIFTYLPTYAQNPPTNETVLDSIVTKYFHILERSHSEALKFLFKLPTDINTNSLLELERKITSESRTFGKYYSFSKLAKVEPDSSLVLISCLARYEKAGLRYNFIFYKPNKDWKLYNFSFDINLPDEMLEAGKIYYYEYHSCQNSRISAGNL